VEEEEEDEGGTVNLDISSTDDVRLPVGSSFCKRVVFVGG
jgi:hypothetical protein